MFFFKIFPPRLPGFHFLKHRGEAMDLRHAMIFLIWPSAGLLDPERSGTLRRIFCWMDRTSGRFFGTYPPYLNLTYIYITIYIIYITIYIIYNHIYYICITIYNTPEIPLDANRNTNSFPKLGYPSGVWMMFLVASIA